MSVTIVRVGSAATGSGRKIVPAVGRMDFLEVDAGFWTGGLGGADAVPF
ncbi:hypothetical protein [Bradyrhizobium sp. CCBAU 11357]|nr:hypothetical protein [Bradyrhizobium sp. CCBAU 11357]